MSRECMDRRNEVVEFANRSRKLGSIREIGGWELGGSKGLPTC
jgi:hypothetical protein